MRPRLSLNIQCGPSGFSSSVPMPNNSQRSTSFDGEMAMWDDSMFQQLKPLKEGFMLASTVYQVRHRETRKLMVLKTIYANPDVQYKKKQLQDELKRRSCCKHPNIVEIHGLFFSGPSYGFHLLMEFCEGGSLENVTHQLHQGGRRMEEKVIAQIAGGVLRGLDYLHDRDAYHGEINPSNILLTGAGEVKLNNFGVSRELLHTISITYAESIIYMAPERIKGDNYTGLADVWSTGLVILELVQNRVPFPPGLTLLEMLVRTVNGNIPELEDETPGPDSSIGIVWSSELRGFIKACLTVSVTERPPSKDLLQHPWIKESQEQRTDMASWMSRLKSSVDIRNVS